MFIQRLALWLLVFIAVPKTFELPGLAGEYLGINRDETKVFVAGTVDLFGLTCLLVGTLWISTTNVQRFLITVAIGIYGYLKVRYALAHWHNINPYLSASLIYQFAAGKLLLTLVLGSIVAHRGTPESLRMKGPRHWTSHFFALN